MALMRGAQKLNQLLVRSAKGSQALPLLPHLSFSTDSGQQPEPLPQQSSSSLDSSIPAPSTGLVYARLRGISMNMQKTDVLNLLNDIKLRSDDIRVDYNRNYQPMAMLVQFRSLSDLNVANRTINRKGRLFRLEKVNCQEWDHMMPYNERYVLLQGIPRNALPDDVDRFLRGCSYDSSSIEMFTRQAQPDLIRMAKVRFHSHIEAMNAVIRKNGAFCLNSRIVARLLQ